MAGAFDVYLTMLFVDQGMGNLLTVTEPASSPTAPGAILFNALLDFGGASRKAAETIAFVGNMISNNGTAAGKLDLVTISHRDQDHWNLFPKLFALFEAKGLGLTVDRLRYGDDKARYADIKSKSESVLTALSKLGPSGTLSLDNYPLRSSAFSTVGPLPDIYNATSAGSTLAIRPVAVNAPVITPSEKSVDSTKYNTPSLAIEIKYSMPDATGLVSDHVILLPGDATADTLSYINELLKQDNTDELKVVRMVSVPHHGAVHSIADNYDSSNPDLKTAKKFAEEVDPWSVGASAGFRTYKHPDEEVLRIFEPYVYSSSKKHDYVAYFRGEDTWKTISTEYFFHTNYITGKTDLDPRSARRIIYRIDAAGKFTVLMRLPTGANIITRPRRAAIAMPRRLGADRL